MIRVEHQRHHLNKSLGAQAAKFPAFQTGRLYRISLAFCLVLLQALPPRVSAGQGESASEYELKAAMLYNLTLFVEWPASAYPDSQAPTILCILGRDPFGDSLISLASKRIANGRPLQIRHPKNDKDTLGCHVLYVSSSERRSAFQTISNLKGSSVLTVSEMGQFTTRGGMIQLSLDERQVRFVVNLDTVFRANLRISSRLLALARIVRDSGNASSERWDSTDSYAIQIARETSVQRESLEPDPAVRSVHLDAIQVAQAMRAKLLVAGGALDRYVSEGTLG